MPTSDICIRFFEFLSVASISNRTTNVSPATNGPLTLESCTSMFFSHQSFFAAYLIDASHLCGHAFHLARFDANDIFRIKIIDRLLPFASFAKLHQSHRNIFRTHISSIVLILFPLQKKLLQFIPLGKFRSPMANRLSSDYFVFACGSMTPKTLPAGSSA